MISWFKRLSLTSKILLFVWAGFLAGVFSFGTWIALISNEIIVDLPTFEELENPDNDLATEIYSADGKILGKFFYENRVNTPYSELPEHLVTALIATEDSRFHKHAGIDFLSLARVVIKTVLLGQRSAGGGSTVSQQLAKNLFPRQRFSSITEVVTRKLMEWVIAVRLERQYTKEEIIAMYFNTVEFVNLAHGIKSACSVYFNTTPEELKIEEAAVLVGMVKNPSRYNPRQFPENAFNRRNTVLEQMYKYGYLEEQIKDSLQEIQLEIDYQAVNHNEGLAPYLREHLRATLNAKQPERDDYKSDAEFNRALSQFLNHPDPLYGYFAKHPKVDGTPYNLYSDGLKIITTIDSRMQEYAEQSVYEHMKELQASFVNDYNSVKRRPWNFSKEPETKYKPNYLNTMMRRSWRYISRKRNGMSTDSIIAEFNQPRKMKVFAWDAEGFEKDTILSPLDSIEYYEMMLNTGMMSMDPDNGHVKAYVGGINHKYFKVNHTKSRRQVGSTFKPFVYMMAIDEKKYSPCYRMINGPVTFAEYDNWTPKNSSEYKQNEEIELRDALAHSVNQITARLMKEIGPKPIIQRVHDMGIRSTIPEAPSICLGSVDLTVEEMVESYTAFANQGIHSTPVYVQRIEDKNGNIIEDFISTQTEVFDEEVAYVMLELMKEVVNQGTGRRLRFKYQHTSEIAGKTGTTQDNSDGWFMGVIPDLVTGVWVGGKNPVIRFRLTRDGQGANMALPIYGLYLQKIYKDKRLPYSDEAIFRKPDQLSIEVDCDRYFQVDSTKTIEEQSGYKGLGF